MRAARPMLLSLGALCLILSNAQAAEPVVRKQDRVSAGGAATGGNAPPQSVKDDEDRIIVKGRRPGISPEELKRSVQREARQSLLGFKLTLPRLPRPPQPGM